MSNTKSEYKFSLIKDNDRLLQAATILAGILARSQYPIDPDKAALEAVNHLKALTKALES